MRVLLGFHGANLIGTRCSELKDSRESSNKKWKNKIIPIYSGSIRRWRSSSEMRGSRWRSSDQRRRSRGITIRGRSSRESSQKNGRTNLFWSTQVRSGDEHRPARSEAADGVAETGEDKAVEPVPPVTVRGRCRRHTPLWSLHVNGWRAAGGLAPPHPEPYSEFTLRIDHTYDQDLIQAHDILMNKLD
jgi:hypothetical protein